MKGTFSQFFIVPEDGDIGSPKVITCDNISNDEENVKTNSMYEEEKEPIKNDTRNSINKTLSMHMKNVKIYKQVNLLSP